MHNNSRDSQGSNNKPRYPQQQSNKEWPLSINTWTSRSARYAKQSATVFPPPLNRKTSSFCCTDCSDCTGVGSRTRISVAVGCCVDMLMSGKGTGIWVWVCVEGVRRRKVVRNALYGGADANRPAKIALFWRPPFWFNIGKTVKLADRLQHQRARGSEISKRRRFTPRCSRRRQCD